MKASGFGVALLVAAGIAWVPATADAAVFNLAACVGACGSLIGSITVTITDNASDTNDVNFVISNNTNGDIDYLRLAYDSSLNSTGKITGFAATPTNSVGAPSASFNSGTDAGYAYNVSIDFPNGTGRFNAGEAVGFTLGAANKSNLDASRFSATLAQIISVSIGGQTVKLTTGGDGSGRDQTVPEPASIALFGLAALGVSHRLKRKA